MALYAAEVDLSGLYLQLSRLALHTNDLLADHRVGLLIVEAEDPTRNPLGLARVSIQGTAEPLAEDSPNFEAARQLYVARHPYTAYYFKLQDFLLVRVRPVSARFIAGFGQIIDLDAEAWARLTETPVD
jgi:hypothetical protein